MPDHDLTSSYSLAIGSNMAYNRSYNPDELPRFAEPEPVSFTFTSLRNTTIRY